MTSRKSVLVQVPNRGKEVKQSVGSVQSNGNGNVTQKEKSLGRDRKITWKKGMNNEGPEV